MEPITWAILGAVAVYFLVQSRQQGTASAQYQQQLQQQRTGSNVRVSGGAYDPGGSFSSPLGLASMGLSGFEGLAGSGALGTALAGSAAIPIVGAVAAVGLGIFAAITAHHQQAIKIEGAGMGRAIQHWNQGLVILVQTAAAGAYGYGNNSPQQGYRVNWTKMQSDLSQLYADYQGIVGSFEKGSPALVPPKVAANGVVTPGSQTVPSVCNGPCSYAIHYLQPQWAQALQHMIWASMRLHKTFTVPPLPPNPAKAFPGSAGFTVTY